MSYVKLEEAVNSRKTLEGGISVDLLLRRASQGEIELFAYIQTTATLIDHPIQQDMYGMVLKRQFGLQPPSFKTASIKGFCRLSPEDAQDLHGCGKATIRAAVTEAGDRITFEALSSDN